MVTEQQSSGIPARAMVVQAHPDDAEFGCAGTVARWAAGGAEVVYVLGTSGDKGSDDPAMTPERLIETREAEQREAARILGVKEVEFLRFRDAELVPDLNLRLAITRMIRKHRPEALICQDPTVRWAGQEYIQHPDHIAMGEATLAAVFPSARDRLTFPQLAAEGLAPHKVEHVYLDGTTDPDFWIDITGTFDQKVAALRAHASQVGEADALVEMLRRWARDSAAEARSRRFPGADAMDLAEAYKYFHLG
ncbi:MAG TPA: PIG-L deacetylase family protein [Thermomicrobiaceae bacterium]|nr:PIG-L deacetylase family protein [Thermomicrobiaceae bacterium]